MYVYWRKTSICQISYAPNHLAKFNGGAVVKNEKGVPIYQVEILLLSIFLKIFLRNTYSRYACWRQ